MVDEKSKDERYWKKRNKIYRAIGCSHHPDAALDLVLDDYWSDNNEIELRDFYAEHPFGIISKKALAELSPRQMFAYDTLKKSFWLLPALSYMCGRVVRNGFSVLDKEESLDALVLDAGSSSCGCVCTREAYAAKYPLSSALDKITGILPGLAVAPLVFVVGLAYTPKSVRTETLTVS
ncbi:MAG: hypothetical protein V1906_00665, partial [Candidatus Woesearchaeota archaeon]